MSKAHSVRINKKNQAHIYEYLEQHNVGINQLFNKSIKTNLDLANMAEDKIRQLETKIKKLKEELETWENIKELKDV